MTDDGKWVLVTGASTGIGKACVEYLGANGFHVYAGARKVTDIEDLSHLANVVAVKLDVTSDSDVQAVKELIEKRGTGLYGLVNNAGIGLGGPLMDITEAELQKQFDVNLLGVHRVTRAFFPFILNSKGRVVMMSSGNGRIPMPFIGPYVMSKFGLEGYSDVLRQETLLLSVKVVIVEPGVIKTPIWEKGLGQVDGLVNRKHSSEFLTKIALATLPKSLEANSKNGKEPIDVARAVHEALTAEKPKLRYTVMSDVFQFKIAQILGAKVIDKMVLKEFQKVSSRLPGD